MGRRAELRNLVGYIRANWELLERVLNRGGRGRVNKIITVYIHPIPNIFMLRMREPIPYWCCQRSRGIVSRLIGIDITNGIFLSAGAWSNAWKYAREGKASDARGLYSAMGLGRISRNGLGQCNRDLEAIKETRLVALSKFQLMLRSQKNSEYPIIPGFRDSVLVKPEWNPEKAMEGCKFEGLPELVREELKVFSYRKGLFLYLAHNNLLARDIALNILDCDYNHIHLSIRDALENVVNTRVRRGVPYSLVTLIQSVFATVWHLDTDVIRTHHYKFSSSVEGGGQCLGGIYSRDGIPDGIREINGVMGCIDEGDWGRRDWENILRLVGSENPIRVIIVGAMEGMNEVYSNRWIRALQMGGHMHQIAIGVKDSIRWDGICKDNLSRVRCRMTEKRKMGIFIIENRAGREKWGVSHIEYKGKWMKGLKKFGMKPMYYTGLTRGISTNSKDAWARIEILNREKSEWVEEFRQDRGITGWDRMMDINTEILGLITAIGYTSHIVNKIRDMSSIKDYRKAFNTKGAYIYVITDLRGSEVYIGQLGAYKRRGMRESMENWGSLEREPGARWKEHIYNALSYKRGVGKGYKNKWVRVMSKEPNVWVMVPVEYIGIRDRSSIVNRERYWYYKFYPNVFNSVVPGGTGKTLVKSSNID